MGILDRRYSHWTVSISFFNKMKNNKEIKLLDKFDWAAIGIAACGVILLINVIIGVM